MKKNMFRRTLFVLLAIAMFMALFASCASPSTASNSADNSKGTASQGKLKAAMVTPQKLGDKGPIDLCYEGLQKGAKDFGYDIKVIEAEEGEYEDSIKAMAEDGYNIVFCIFTATLDGLTRVAPKYPNTKFVMILGECKGDNVKNLFYREQEASFLCGVVAAKTTASGKIAAIRGADVGDNIRFTAGFFHGAKTVNPSIECKPLLAGSFEDPTKGKELANLAMDQGCDIIMQICAKTSLGIREAIAERGKKYKMVGIVNDSEDAIPGQMLCTSQTNYNVWIYNSMKELAEGKFKSGTFWEGLKEGATDILYTANVPADVKTLAEDYRKKIISGEIVVDEKF